MPEPSAEAKRKLLQQLRCTVPAGEVIFREGEQSRELYILLQGSLEIRKGEQVIATVAEKDTYIGEMSTLLGTPRTATVAAAEDSVLVRVPQERVEDFFNHSPALALKLSRILATRLQEMNEKHEALIRESATPGYRHVELYERLTATAARRAFLRLYGRQRGATASLPEVNAELGIAPAEMARLCADFQAAGLLRQEGETLHFAETPGDDLAGPVAAFLAGPAEGTAP
jgi:CRP-like cAMP-binding protein